MIIANGTIHDGLGFVGVRDLRVEDGKITALAEKLPPNPGEEVFDAAGLEVLPGFVQPISLWGVNGSMQEIRPSSNDNDERSNPIMPELDGFYAFNGRAATYQQLGAFGLTCCGVAPSDNNLFGGSIAMFCVDGVNPYKMCLKRDCGMMASVTPNIKQSYGARQVAPMTRMWIFTNFGQQLKKAAEYEETADKPKDDKLAALQRVVKGETPLFVSCDSAAAAEHVHDILTAYPEVKLVLVNGFGLTGEEDWIVEKKVPILVRTAANPMDENAMTLDLKAIAKFMDEGVPVAFSGNYTNSLGIREDMLWNGIEMMRVLHDSEKVLPMLTSVPANIMGVADQTGSLQEGLRADVVLWRGNPLKTYQATIVRTYQAGRVIYKEGDEMKCM